MALIDELAKLHEVQKIDWLIYQREQAIRALDSGESQKQKAIQLLKQHDAILTRLKALEADQRNRELEINGIEDKRNEVHERLYSGRVTNPKELADMQAEEEALQSRISDLEGPVIELMDQVAEAKTVEATLDGELAAAKRRWKETVARTQAETIRLQHEIAALRPEREQLAALVEDKILLRRYDDIRSRREGVGLAVTATDLCPACQIKLTAAVMDSLRLGETLTICENCGRMLMLLR